MVCKVFAPIFVLIQHVFDVSFYAATKSSQKLSGLKVEIADHICI